MQGLVIAIDGPAAAGKGTLARGLAADLGVAILETGLLYRAVARMLMVSGIDPSDQEAAIKAARSLRPADASGRELRGETVGRAASVVSCIPGVRAALVDFQRAFAANPPGGCGAVLDGRDIGTVICPGADLKIYVVADTDTRAARRLAESRAAGDCFTLDEVRRSIVERDERESQRAVAPMRPADDAVIIDSTFLTAAEVLETALAALGGPVRSPGTRI